MESGDSLNEIELETRGYAEHLRKGRGNDSLRMPLASGATHLDSAASAPRDALRYLGDLGGGAR